MKKIQLNKTFKATPEQLWELIVDADHYRFWTAAFSKGSDFVGDWTPGSKMRFIADDPPGSECGMLSEIAESNWPEFLSIHHIGLLNDGTPDYDSSMAKEWTPAYENYQLIKKSEDLCTFELEQDVPESYAESLIDSWNLAFEAMELRLATSDAVGKVITLREHSIHTPLELWDRLVSPEKVRTWNYASDDWYCPKAKNELKIGGEFHYDMSAKDGSFSFDFWGTYTEIETGKKLSFDLGDGRKVQIDLIEKANGTLIEERFEAEEQNNLHLQRTGWQEILKNLAR